MFRTGKYVLFELHSDCELPLMVVTTEGIKRATVTNQHEINAMLIVLQRAHDSRLVGIYQGAETMRGADGSCVVVPPCIVPQRAAMVNGGHNLYWLAPGETQAYRLLLPLDSVKRLELLTRRDDIPADKILSPNYDPADGCS